MTLEVLVPFEVLARMTDVTRIVAEGPCGSFGLLPHRLDCVSALKPGILTCEVEGKGEVLLAVDHGLLIKTGQNVVVSVRRALRGTDLGHLRQAVEKEFVALDAQRERARTVMVKLQAELLQRMAALRS
jgi:F-type H+-transporting ATPase subunit epsilon